MSEYPGVSDALIDCRRRISPSQIITTCGFTFLPIRWRWTSGPLSDGSGVLRLSILKSDFLKFPSVLVCKSPDVVGFTVGSNFECTTLRVGLERRSCDALEGSRRNYIKARGLLQTNTVNVFEFCSSYKICLDQHVIFSIIIIISEWYTCVEFIALRSNL